MANDVLSPIPGLGEGQPEAVYAVGLALLGTRSLTHERPVTFGAGRYLKLAAPGNAVASAS